MNSNFLRCMVIEVEAAGIKKDTKIIVVCLNGGTTKPSETFTIGKESRLVRYSKDFVTTFVFSFCNCSP